MKNQFEYILGVFKTIYQVPGSVEIGYGPDNGKAVHIKSSSTKIFEQKTDLDPAEITWNTWLGADIPFLFSGRNLPVYEYDGKKIRINYDIIAASFYFLSGWQEWVAASRDELGRFSFTQSLQNRLKIAGIPVVNYYFDVLKTAIEKAYNLEIPFRNSFTAFISHDVDKMESGWKEGGLRALKSGKAGEFLSLQKSKISGKDAWFNLSEIARIEMDENIRSTFFIMARKGQSAKLDNADYDIKQSKYQASLEFLAANDFEIAVHGSLSSHKNIELLKEDITRLDREIQGNRFHYLNFEIDKTVSMLEKSGLQYDSTLGFSETIGFRNGICHPFRLYDLAKERQSHVLEIPLNFMDATLNQSKYMGVTRDRVLPLAAELMDEVQKFNGVFSLNWHNTYFSPHKFNGWREIFLDIISELKNRGAWFKTGRHIQKLFR